MSELPDRAFERIDAGLGPVNATGGRWAENVIPPIADDTHTRTTRSAPCQAWHSFAGRGADDAPLAGDGDADLGIGGRSRRHPRDGRPRSRSTGRLASYGISIGTLIPGLLLVVLAAIYLLQGNASAAPLNAHHVLPAWHGLSSVVLIVNSFFLYAGVEVNAVHVDELRDAPREYPKATLLAVVLILLVFIFPTLAISVAIPAPHISFAAGVMQAFKSLLDHFGLGVLTPIIAVGLVVASLSGLLDWLTGPSLEDPTWGSFRCCGR